jgi:hypothetical protein
MALSAETKAIIETLKAEGVALREGNNTNSIGTMNVKLDRLSGVLESVAKSLQAQTSVLVDSAAQEKAAREKAALQAELESVKKKKKEDEKKTEKVDLAKEIRSAIPNMLKGLQRTLGNFLIGGIGALALGGFVTGIADNLTGGGFSKFINDFIGGDWEQIRTSLAEGGYNFSDGINKMLTFTTRLAPGGDLNEKITSFIDAIAPVTAWLIENPLLGLGAVLAGGAALKFAMKALTRNLRRTAVKLAVGGLAALSTGLLGKPPKADVDVDGAKAKADAAKAKADAEAAKAKADAEAKLRKGQKLTPDQLDALAGRGKYATAVAPGVKATAPEVMSESPKKANFAFTGDDGTKYVTTQDGAIKRADSSQGRFISNMSGNLVDLDKSPTVATKPPVEPMKPGDLGKKLAAENKGKVAKLIAKKMVGVAVKAVPVLGAAVGAWFAAVSLAKGDITSAGLEGGSIFLPSLSGVPVDIMAVATSTFFDTYGMSYNPADPEHREMMKDILEQVEQAFEDWKNKKDLDAQTAYEEGDSMTRAEMNARAERAIMGYNEMNGSYLGITPGMATGLGGVTTRTAPAGFFGGFPSADENADFFEQMKQGQYYAGSAANLAMHEQLAAKGGGGGGTYNDNRVTNNVVQGGDTVQNSSDAAVIQYGGEGSGTRPGMGSVNVPGSVQ